MRSWLIACVACAHIFTVGISRPVTSAASQGSAQLHFPKDSWYRQPPLHTDGKWKEIDRSKVHPVEERVRLKAEALLERKPIIELTAAQTSTLMGKDLTSPQGTRPFLVRAVYYDRGSGSFTVSILGDRIFIHHDSLGPWPTPMFRNELLVFLKRMPREVYVACSRAT